ncbi:MAG: hypothetical protein Fur0020_03020 [Thermodesulfovibrionia bacterium]
MKRNIFVVFNSPIGDTFIILIIFLLILPSSVLADKKDIEQINEKLIRIEERMVTKDELKAEIKDVRTEIKDVRTEIKDVRTEIKQFMLWGFGILFGGMGLLIGFVIWDRRTALTPVVKRYKELEEREELVEKALREYAKIEPRLAEILKSMRLI